MAVSGNTLTLQITADNSFATGDYIVISQVRVNVNALGAGTTTISATATGTSAQPTVYPITFTQATVPVASVVNPSLSVAFTSATSPIPTCNIGIPGDPTETTGFPPTNLPAGAFAVTFTENFPRAMTSLAEESSYTPSFPPANGTQFSVTISNVPAGMAAYIWGGYSNNGEALAFNYITPYFVVSTGAPITFTKVLSADASPASVSSDVTIFQIGYPNAAGTAFAAGSIASLPANAQIQASFSIGPVQAVSSGAVAFAANSVGPSTVATIGNCATNLLFPFITNQVGFDTSVQISNTTANATAFGAGVGANPQSGTCQLTFYPTDLTTQTGTSAGATSATMQATTPSIASGGVYQFMQSASTFAGQSGYMFAVCQFLDAHGFSFVLNGNASSATISQGLLALVITNGSNRLPAANYESLGH